METGLSIILDMPLGIQELVMGGWLVIAGCNKDAVKKLDKENNQNDKREIPDPPLELHHLSGTRAAHIRLCDLWDRHPVGRDTYRYDRPFRIGRVVLTVPRVSYVRAVRVAPEKRCRGFRQAKTSGPRPDRTCGAQPAILVLLRTLLHPDVLRHGLSRVLDHLADSLHGQYLHQLA